MVRRIVGWALTILGTGGLAAATLTAGDPKLGFSARILRAAGSQLPAAIVACFLALVAGVVAVAGS